MLAVCLLVLAGAFTVAGTATATASEHAYVAAQPTDTVTPSVTGPDIDAPQQTDPTVASETKKKLWIGGIALVLFALVYLRNRKRWTNWRKSRK
ncbi:hypothetical protein GCM10022243_06880 [Saccharothrix violaceirubra]